MRSKTKKIEKVYDLESVSTVFNSLFIPDSDKGSSEEKMKQLIIQHFLLNGKKYKITSYSNPRRLYYYNTTPIFDRIGKKILKLAREWYKRTGSSFRSTFTDNGITFDVNVVYSEYIEIGVTDEVLHEPNFYMDRLN